LRVQKQKSFKSVPAGYTIGVLMGDEEKIKWGGNVDGGTVEPEKEEKKPEIGGFNLKTRNGKKGWSLSVAALKIH